MNTREADMIERWRHEAAAGSEAAAASLLRAGRRRADPTLARQAARAALRIDVWRGVDAALRAEAIAVFTDADVCRTLAEALADGPLPPTRAVEVIGGVLARAARAHQRGLIGLAPALTRHGVWFDAGERDEDAAVVSVEVALPGDARLSDAPLPTRVDLDAATPEQVRGEPPATTVTAYGGPAPMVELGLLPPERIRGLPRSLRSDVYALGGLLYEALCGAPAYGSGGFMETLQRVVAGPPTPLAACAPQPLPAPLIALVERAMAHDPDARFADAGELLEALREVAGPGWASASGEAAGQGAALGEAAMGASAPPRAGVPHRGVRASSRLTRVWRWLTRR